MAGNKPRVASPPSEVWVELAESAMRESGYRSSLPRSAVVGLIGRQDCVLTAHEIANQLDQHGSKVAIATIYRTLELLEELKLLKRLDVGGQPARFEPALPGGEHHHHHLVCDRCGRVTPFEDADLERAIEALAKRLDHTVGEHEVTLRGSCPECAGRSD
jgi:Fur family ferric uptake transcriptional regulator